MLVARPFAERWCSSVDSSGKNKLQQKHTKMCKSLDPVVGGCRIALIGRACRLMAP